MSNNYSGSPLPANTGTIAQPEKPPFQTAIGPVNLILDISITIAARHLGWITTFSRAGNTIISDEAKAEPWLDKDAPVRLSSLLISAIPELNKGFVLERLKDCFTAIQDSPDGQALVSEAVSRIMKETISVSIERSEKPTYIITLDGGHTLSFEAKEIAALQPISLNEKWLSIHPREPLYAKGRDFMQVIDYWVSIAEEVDPAGAVSPWEVITEQLQDKITLEPVHHEPAGLIRSGLYLDGEILWISNNLIHDELRQHGKDNDAAGFSRYLNKSGYLIRPSKSHRIGTTYRRAWGFHPQFRSTETPISSFASLEEEGDRI